MCEKQPPYNLMFVLLAAQYLLLRAHSRENRDQDYCGDQRRDHIYRVEIREILDNVSKQEIDQPAQKRSYKPHYERPPELPQERFPQNNGVEYGCGKSDYKVC